MSLLSQLTSQCSPLHLPHKGVPGFGFNACMTSMLTVEETNNSLAWRWEKKTDLDGRGKPLPPTSDIWNMVTWNTVSRDWGKLSKVLRRVSSKLNFPPKSCIPSKEKMMMKRKSRSSREAMERTEFSREATRLDREFQYLEKQINMCSYAKM